MSVQIVLFSLYFVVIFAIGWYSLKRTRDESDYWIAGGKLGWLLGGATIGATHASAGTFVGTIGVIYTAGWSFAWIVLSIPLAYWFMAAVLAPRFTRSKELTLPAFIETRYYSKAVRRLAAVIILIATVVYVQAQIVAGGIISNIVFGIPTQWGMIGFTIILIVYTSIGGMLAVVYTDFIQLVIMIVGVVAALPLAIRGLGGLGPLFTYVQAVKPETFTWESFPPALLFTMGLAFTLGTIATPEKLVRLYAMRDMRTIRRGILFAILVATGLNLVIFVIALTSIVIFPALPSGDLAMPMVARAVLPPVLGSVLLAAIAAAIMSTVLGLALMLTTSTEKEIAINYRWGQQAFFNADAGLEFGKNVLASYALQDGDFQNILPPVRVLGSMTLKPNDVGACADETIAGCRDYQYFIDLDGATRMYIGKVLRDINGRLVQYDFRQPLGNDTLNDIDFDGTSDVQGTVTLWVRRPLVGGADYAQDDRIILTAEGTAPNGQGIGSGRNVAMRRLEQTLLFSGPGGGREGDKYSAVTKNSDTTSTAADAGLVAGSIQ